MTIRSAGADEFALAQTSVHRCAAMGRGIRDPADVSSTGVHEVGAIDVFAGFSAPQLEDCARGASRRHLAKGQLVFHQGGKPARFHALLSGWVRILQTGPDGGLSIIRFVGPGEIFGAFALFAEQGYPADATAAVDARELSWSESQLRELIERYPRIAMNLVGVAARRLSELQERFREVSTQCAEQRVANALLRISRTRDSIRNQTPVEIPLPLTRKDVAALSATTLHTASRVMAAWERRGILISAGRLMSIVLPTELARIGEGQ